jgi:hypothetical protein
MKSGHILSEYGPERKTEGNRASNGGRMEKKELPYSPPVGPKGQSNNSPGLGGTNHGCCGTQGKH